MAPTVEYLEERFDTFNRMCFDGRHLTISHKSTPEELNRDTRIRRMLRWSPTVRSSVRFDSRDPWFNRFPRCRTAKLFPVEPEELRKHMNEEFFVSCSP